MRISGTVAITGHFERQKVRRLAQKAGRILHNLGVDCLVADIKKKNFNRRGIGLVIAVGGDGTMLHVARELKKPTPVVGIAAGKRSALMAIKPEKVGRALEKIAAGKFTVQERVRLQAITDGKRLPLALNEVMLVNKKSGAMVNYCVRVKGKRLYCGKADGCIIATPTGSTGHAYSAGGKKLPAGGKKIAIVPSNPYCREAKPVYAGGGCTIALDGFGKQQEHEVVLDGQPRFTVRKRLAAKKGESAFFVKF